MFRTLLILIAYAAFSSALQAQTVLDTMDELRFRLPKEKGKAEVVEGKVGKAVRFSVEAGGQNVFFFSRLRGDPAWDKAAGVSFWVKGEGSDAMAGLQFIYDDDFAVRYDLCFSIKNTEWTKLTFAWDDFIPVLPGPRAQPLGLPKGNPPSKISAVWLGKWWYWRDYPAYSFALDDLRLEEKIERKIQDYQPQGAPLARTLAKLHKGEPVTIVTMGDSLADTKHWANREVSWPLLLKKSLEGKYKSKVTIVNPAIGGTQLRQNLILVPRWLATAPAPDLVTCCFGFNDWDSGMRGPQFQQSNEDAVERLRRATQGQADVLLLTTLPALERWTTMAELAAAGRAAAREKNAGLADTEKAFLDAPKDAREKLFVRDRTHLAAPGHEVVAITVLEAIERGGK